MKEKITIALAGNPNSGKSTVFNAITGARQHIANYPGVTVEKKFGSVIHKGAEIKVVDLPGTYSLTAYSLEEIVARDFLVNEKPDLVVDIVDASNLDRNLYLAVQLKEFGVPMVIALNMMDVAESRGINVDHQLLSTLFQAPVVPMVARSKQGIRECLDKVLEAARLDREWRPAVISYGNDIDRSLEEIDAIIRKSQVLNTKYPSRWCALKCLEGDRQILDLLKKESDLGRTIEDLCRAASKHTLDTLDEDPQSIIAGHRYGYIAGITRKALKRKVELRLNLSDKIDKVLTNRIVGPLLMIAILYGIYAFTFSASEVPIHMLEAFFRSLKDIVSAIIPAGNLRSLIVSGIIDGVGGVLGFIPLIMFMFFAVAILEDSGYMARVAYMLDRVLSWFGLHGNSVIALIVSGGISGGCAVPGIMATRTLRDPRERIATLLVVPFMNCGAKLPVYAMLIGAFFFKDKARIMFILTLFSWGFALVAAKILRSTVLRGPKTPFVMELPPYRMPTLKGLLIHTWERTWYYVRKAGTVILGFSIVLWAMMNFPGPSQEEDRSFEDARVTVKKSLLASPEIRDWIPDGKTLTEMNGLYDYYTRAVKKGEAQVRKRLEGSPFLPLIETAYLLKEGKAPQREMESGDLQAASRYLFFRKEMVELDDRQRQAALKRTIAGRLGHGLETITAPLGFDYRINIALLGGFAAKEVVVSTLGTAYSIGEVDTEESSSLSQRLRRDPGWDPLKAFTLIIFTMLYVPCIVSVISIRRESSWMWAGFSIGFNLIAAFLVAFIIRYAGITLGLGTS
ncbi:MAG: ferrous iron transport protein B [Pseudomonadota bacterium]